MSYYFWLGDYHPYADEDPETEWETTEADGWITTYPKLDD
jgi:hypothetical protein